MQLLSKDVHWWPYGAEPNHMTLTPMTLAQQVQTQN